MFDGKIIAKDRPHVHILTEEEFDQIKKEYAEDKRGVMGTFRPDLRDRFAKMAEPMDISEPMEELLAKRKDISDEVQ